MTPTARFADISHFEPVTSFHDLQASGSPLLITKASEGNSYTDSTYADYAQRVRSVPGLILGAYVFEDAAPEGPQIAHYMSTAHLRDGDLQPIVDAEASGLTKQEVFGAMADLENRGFRPILYASLSYFNDVLGAPTKWWLWLAAYRDTLPALPSGVKLFAWQFSDHAQFPGIPNPCDGNHLYVPAADLDAKFCIT